MGDAIDKSDKYKCYCVDSKVGTDLIIKHKNIHSESVASQGGDLCLQRFLLFCKRFVISDVLSYNVLWVRYPLFVKKVSFCDKK